MTQPLVHARSVEQLADVDWFLHDMGFSMSAIAYDDARASVRIPFCESSRVFDLSLRGLLDLRPGRSARRLARAKNYVLEISHVTGVEVSDPAGLEEHTYSRLRVSDDGRLTVVSNIRGGIEMDIAEIDVALLTQENTPNTLRNARPWPVEGYVAIIGADAQEHVLVPVHVIEAMPVSERKMLRSSGDVEWLAPEAVLHELHELLGLVTEADTEPVRRAIEITEYACTTRTGVAVAPPPTSA